MGASSKLSIEQVRRLDATNFHGTTDSTKALFWLFETEKILDEGMHCSDDDKVRITGFLLEGDARKWWLMERDMRLHT